MVIAEDQVRKSEKVTFNVSKTLQIAIDGPAGAGKSTVAKKVADMLGYLYIDTGAMYRAVTWLSLKAGVDVADQKSIAQLAADAEIELKPGDSLEKIHVFVNGEEVTREIRSEEITKLVSPLSAITAVRDQLVKQQRRLASSGGVVLDGRDIGTVVLPDANVKIFLTASPEIRAQRRLAELKENGVDAEFNSILANIVERDDRDSNRKLSPLRMADDAVLILSDKMSIDDVVSHIIKLCQ